MKRRITMVVGTAASLWLIGAADFGVCVLGWGQC